MGKPSLILIGAGGHARACIDVVDLQGDFAIAGLVGRRDELNTRHLGYEVVATDDELPALAHAYGYALVAVGQIRSPDTRIRLYQRVRELDWRLAVVVSPTAYVSKSAELGPGTIVMHGAVINAGAKVGSNSIVNSRALIEHDARIGDHCHISTGAILNGDVQVDEGSFIGSGAVVREGVTIGRHSVIGMGAVVRKNQPHRTLSVSGSEE